MRIRPDQDDAADFIAEVQGLVDGLLRHYAPRTVVLIKIDNFFGSRWLRFSGKALGALGVWKKRLNVPPFVPNRVVSQLTFAGPLYDEAVRIVTETRKASISGVQRRLKIGYNRAARLVEAMEAAGLVGPLQSNGAREIYGAAPPEE